MNKLMSKILIIGCPGSGKSTLSRKINEYLNLPFLYLDMIFHRADRTTAENDEFDNKLKSFINTHDKWIIDGNYKRTLDIRLSHADTVIWLDYPVDLCLKGVENRRGKERPDIPWIEYEEDVEFTQYIKDFKKDQVPKILDLLEKHKDYIEIHRLKSREETERWFDDTFCKNWVQK